MTPQSLSTDRAQAASLGRSPRFAESCAEALGELSAACGALLDALARPIHRAVDLERELGVNKKLAWQVFRIGRMNRPIGGAEGLNVPTRAGIGLLTKAARRRRVPSRVIDRLVGAFDAFESFVAEHAGDRESFHTIIGSLAASHAGAAGSGRRAQAVAEKHRTAMYQAASHVWGVRTDATIRCEVFFPKEGCPEKLDSVAIHGALNLHRLRRDAHLAIEVGAYDAAALSESGAPILLADFSDPIEAGHWAPAGHGRMRLELSDLGRAAAASFYFTHTNRPAPDAPRLDLSTGVAISMPTALSVVDLMVPVGLSEPARASVTVYGSRSEYPFPRFDPVHVLNHREHVHTVRDIHASEVPIVPEFQSYPDAVRHVLKTLGWDAVRFDHYRCRVAYPYFHTHIWLRAESPAET